MINTTGWTIDAIYNKVLDNQTIGIMYHSEFKNAFCLLGLHGYKRWHEYKIFDEVSENIKTEHFYINKHHKVIKPDNTSKPVLLNELYNMDSMTAEPAQIEKLVENIFKSWYKWEKSVQDLYSACVDWCIKNQVIDRINFENLQKGQDKEIKKLERHLIKLKNVKYDLDCIIDWQDDIHDKYKHMKIH